MLLSIAHVTCCCTWSQVTDTPGLLERPLSERNAMERLTLACLNHLPSAVLFVLDLTAQCGTSVQDQLAIRSHPLPFCWLQCSSTIDEFVLSCMHAFVRSFADLLAQTLANMLVNMGLSAHPSLPLSIHALTDSLIRSLTHSFTYPTTHPPSSPTHPPSCGTGTTVALHPTSSQGLQPLDLQISTPAMPITCCLWMALIPQVGILMCLSVGRH